MSTHTQLSFDGFGINDADDYRTRLATFAAHVPDDRRKELGALWIAAPTMLEALKELADMARVQLDQSATNTGLANCHLLAKAREAIRLAEGRP